VGLRLEETAPEGLLQALAARREEERLRGQTLVGPHRDDLVFLLGGRPAHRFASRGEAKALALALRLAEHRLLSEHHGEPPLLLVDEWSEELDEARRAALLAYAKSLPQAILAGLLAPEGVPVCWVQEGVVLCPGG
jgi:DNA replication and repair protein RecF